MNNNALIKLEENFVNEAISAALARSHLQPQGLLSLQMVKQKAEIEALAELKFFFDKVKNGCTHLTQAIHGVEGEEGAVLAATIDQIQTKLMELNQFDDQRQADVLRQDIQHYWGTTAELRLKLYFIAKGILEKKEFEKSAEIFLVLTLLFPQIAEFWLGLGIAEKGQHNLDAASLMFVQAILLNPQLIQAYLYAIECYLDQQDIPLASEILNSLFENNREDQIEPSLKEKITSLKTIIHSMGG